MGKYNSMIEDRVNYFWNASVATIASSWAYFQPIHHLLEALLLVMLLNLAARIMKSVRGWKLRRSRKRRFSLSKWREEVNFGGTCLEFALVSFGVMSLCVFYKILYPIEDDASSILDVTKYIVYFILIAYFVLFLKRIGEAWPDNYIVKVVKILVKKVDLLKMIPLFKSIPEDVIKDIEDIADGHDKKK